MNNCLYCYKESENKNDFHSRCSKSFFGTVKAPILDYTLEQMDELAKQLVKRSVSVPGVQPKLSMSIINEAKEKSDKRLTVVGALGGNYIFKPPSENYYSMPENEHLTMRLAEVFGINVVPSCLIRLKSGEISYITKRIDRTESGKKIHMLDMFQILDAFDKYKGSMEKVGKAIGQYSSNPLLDKVILFELLVFSFLVGNNDMHLKNFSMINSSFGWVLSPAYDLLNVSILLPEDNEELALSIKGKKKRLTKENFKDYALELGLSVKQIDGIFNRFQKNIIYAIDLINASLLPSIQKKKYLSLMEKRIARLNLAQISKSSK